MIVGALAQVSTLGSAGGLAGSGLSWECGHCRPPGAALPGETQHLTWGLIGPAAWALHQLGLVCLVLGLRSDPGDRVPTEFHHPYVVMEGVAGAVFTRNWSLQTRPKMFLQACPPGLHIDTS